MLALFAVRPITLSVALIKSGLSRAEWIAAAWFGPKGFVSVAYALLALQLGTEDSGRLFHLVAMVVLASIVLHSTTDVLVAPVVRGEGGARPRGG